MLHIDGYIQRIFLITVLYSDQVIWLILLHQFNQLELALFDSLSHLLHFSYQFATLNYLGWTGTSVTLTTLLAILALSALGSALSAVPHIYLLFLIILDKVTFKCGQISEQLPAILICLDSILEGKLDLFLLLNHPFIYVIHSLHYTLILFLY